MAIIENTAERPDITAGFHTLAVEFVELEEGTKYGEPDVPETRVKMQLRVETPDEPQETFTAWMSQSLGEKATLGCIVRAALGNTAVGYGQAFDTDDLIGKKFQHMIQINENGWPRLVSGTAAPVTPKRRGKKTDEQPAATSLEEVPWTEPDEPPF